MSEAFTHRMVGEAIAVLSTLAAGLAESDSLTQEQRWSYYLDCPRQSAELASVFAASRFASHDGQVHAVLSGHGPEEMCSFTTDAGDESSAEGLVHGRSEGRLRLANPQQVGNRIIAHRELQLCWSRDDMFMGQEVIGAESRQDWAREPVYVCSYVISAIASQSSGRELQKFLMQVCCISDDCSMLVMRATVPMNERGAPHTEAAANEFDQGVILNIPERAVSGKMLLRRLPTSLGLRLSPMAMAV